MHLQTLSCDETHYFFCCYVRQGRFYSCYLHIYSDQLHQYLNIIKKAVHENCKMKHLLVFPIWSQQSLQQDFVPETKWSYDSYYRPYFSPKNKQQTATIKYGPTFHKYTCPRIDVEDSWQVCIMIILFCYNKTNTLTPCFSHRLSARRRVYTERLSALDGSENLEVNAIHLLIIKTKKHHIS